MLSSSCKYGIRAAAYLARQEAEQDTYVPIRQVSRDLDISFHFLTKVLQTLTQQEIVTSQRGPSGGVSLARPARTITVLDIILALDGAGLFSDCILGLPKCSDRNPCPLHGDWGKERQRLYEVFSRMTLAKLARTNGSRP